MKGVPLSRESYVRVLPFSAMRTLAMQLDADQFWERMIQFIPKHLDPGAAFSPRYTTLHVSVFSRQNSPTRAILQDWQTQNCTLNHLISVLEDARLVEAANYIKKDILHETLGEEEEEADENQLPIPTPLLPPLVINAVPGNHPDRVLSADSVDYASLDETKMADTTTTSTRQPVQNDLSITPPPSVGSLAPVPGPSMDRRTLNHNNAYVSLGGREALAQCSPNLNSLDSEDKKKGKAADKKVGDEFLKPHAVYAPPPLDRFPSISAGNTDYLTPTLPDNLTPTLPDYLTPAAAMAQTEPREEIIQPVVQYTGSLQHIQYNDLSKITDDFNETRYSQGGRLIGKGGFGLVHLGVDHDGKKIAVKVLRQNTEPERKQFHVEVKTLEKHKHENLVLLLGYSLDGPKPCIVFEYLPRGSLEDRLARLNGSPPLTASTRMSICKGSARAIAYLNNCGFIHRDVKSANILLDEDFVPKLGDFATARIGPSGSSLTVAETNVVIGTSAYIAPEAYNFDVSAKLDSFSFGVVILEILTGLPAFDASREDRDLRTHMNENCDDIMEMVDTLAGEWLESVAKPLYKIALRCMETKKKRALVNDVLPHIESL